MNESTFGTLLRRHRLAAGLTQEALAERAGMSAEGIGALERGHRQVPYRATVALLAEALRLPPAAAAELERAADRRPRPRARHPGPAAERAPHNLPLAPTRFLGRERELAEVRRLMGQSRLVTLTGTGGIGKTRAALYVAAEFIGRKADGVWFVNLATLTDSAMLPGAVAGAVGISATGDTPVERTLLATLSQRRVLIVLDNCEHVVAAAANLANALLLACPQVQLLVTSREPLNTAGEQVYRMPSLEVPAPDVDASAAEAAMYSAVALFVERAQAADAGFLLSDATAPVVAEIARRLDGIPLAIELAAARIAVLGVRAIAQRIDGRFRLLTGGNRTALPRHQTLRAAFDWSHDLLTNAERALFRRVAIFAGGWTLEAAEAVCADAALDATDVVFVLGSLVEKSLVVADADGNSVRYRLLESSRAYASEKLNDAQERTTLAGRHAQWFDAFVERADEDAWTQPLRDWIADVEPEADNIRAALHWAFDVGDDVRAGRIVGNLLDYWRERALPEGRRWVETALARLDADSHPTVVARLFLTSATLHNANRTVEAAARAISLLEPVDDSRTLAWANSRLAYGLLQTGRLEAAATAFDRALHLYERAGLQRTRRFVGALLVRGTVYFREHRLDDARRSCAAGLAHSESLGDEEETARARINLAEVEFAAGDARRALELVRQASGIRGLSSRLEANALSNTAAYMLALGDGAGAEAAARAALVHHRRTHRHGLAARTILQLAAALAIQGDVRRAGRLLGFADAWAQREGIEWETTEATSRSALAATLRIRLTADEIAQLTAAGARLNDEEAIDEALASRAGVPIE